MVDLEAFAQDINIGVLVFGDAVPNTPPVVDTPIPDQECTVGVPFGPLDVSGNFSDPELQALAFSATNLPKGLIISPTGIISGTPTGGF